MYCENRQTLSVIMGVRYLSGDIGMLKRSVESILEQTHKDFEFLICEGGSTAEAKAYLERLPGVDARVRLVDGEDSPRHSQKLNKCLKAAQGRYIARMDDDDWSHPDRLEKQIRFLEENDDISFVGCNVTLVQNGRSIGKQIFPCKPIVEDFYFVQPYIHPALVFRREVLDAVEGYCERKDCARCEDYDLLLRLYKAGYKGVNMQELLLDYTVSDGSNRKMRHRLYEAKTRYRRFKDLGKLPGVWPYVVKPIAVGLLPRKAVLFIKSIHNRKTRSDGYC